MDESALRSNESDFRVLACAVSSSFDQGLRSNV